MREIMDNWKDWIKAKLKKIIARWYWPATIIPCLIYGFSYVNGYQQILGTKEFVLIGLAQTFFYFIMFLSIGVNVLGLSEADNNFHNFIFSALIVTGLFFSLMLVTTFTPSLLEAETARALFSSSFLAMVGVLTIIAMLSIFIIQIEHSIPQFLVGIKIIIALDSIAALLSLISLVRVPSHSIPIEVMNVPTSLDATTFKIALLYGDTITIVGLAIVLMAVIFLWILSSLGRMTTSNKT